MFDINQRNCIFLDLYKIFNPSGRKLHTPSHYTHYIQLKGASEERRSSDADPRDVSQQKPY